ncbi:cryptochrome-1 [Culicoides brevitarsis]|uniref:cryptochrome-1 n=1 Tax=Culicoides brevitarsis TaxID=469753 RepID=UPI00307C1A11
MDIYNVIWFRHGLRIHDNPALLEAMRPTSNGIVHLLPVFIFDGESSGTKVVGYNRMKFLIEALQDLDNQFRKLGGQLYIFRGDPVTIFRRLWEEFGIKKLCLEQDCEPIWQARDERVARLCSDIGVEFVEKVSHTLWNPNEIIDANGGVAPLTYQMFLHTVQTLGHPPRPIPDVDWTNVRIGKLSALLPDLDLFHQMPTPEDFNIYMDSNYYLKYQEWVGGETEALKLLSQRLKVEENAFKNNFYLPNQGFPDIINCSTSMSPALRFGCLSVRKFYWEIHDLFERAQQKFQVKCPGGPHITGQLIWREYFYTMSVRNLNYAQIEGNPICLNVPWYDPKDGSFERWKAGKTGFPLIDAAMRQLLAEGWIHHTLRNITATFLTRGALWISWEKGLHHFLKYQLDADWSVCAGNWMWVSSSAFEKLLDSSLVNCPVSFGKRLDPNGEYIKRYVPELRLYPKEYIHEPWKAPMSLQQEYECIIGIHYPQTMLDFKEAAKRNRNKMKSIRDRILEERETQPEHCRPSSEDEIRQFFWLSNEIEEEKMDF